MFNYHFKAYPYFQQELADALQHATDTQSDREENLQILQDLYEIYIPTVCCFMLFLCYVLSHQTCVKYVNILFLFFKLFYLHLIFIVKIC